ncbi:MAG: hypothetical protein ACTHJR_04040 [Sphingomonas sp.]|uniref:hypothetical protein n=1 Tax=Sphingomonas sp. TaxID=28214 RepID=UPI003F7E5AF1
MPLWRCALVLAGLAASAASAELPKPNKASLDYYLGEDQKIRADHGVLLDGWETALVAELKQGPTDRAAAALASRYELPAPAMRELIDLWLYAKADMSRPDPTASQRAELHDRFLKLLTDTRRSPLVLEAAAASLISEDRCSPASIDELLSGATDRADDAWGVARAGRTCAQAYVRFAQIAPDRATPALIEAASSDWLPPVAALPLYAYVTSPAALARIDAEHRDAAALYLTHGYIAMLLEAGQDDRAMALFDALSPTDRDILFDGRVGEPAIVADGLPITLDDYEIARDARNLEVRMGLVAAYALAGRTDRAEQLFARLPGTATIRERVACVFATNAGAARPCGKIEDGDAGIALLDHMLHDSGSDPYPMAELFYASHLGEVQGKVPAALTCRVFAGDALDSICADARRSARATAFETGYPDRSAPAMALVEAAHVPDVAAGRSAAVETATRVWGAAERPEEPAFGDRPAAEPLPSPFAVAPIPAALRGTGRAMPWSKEWAPLPKGYDPVRIGREGDRIAVISLSQNYDPTGEVTRGGYWVHLSDDGGRSWRRPLYTGLAERFPYLVLGNPKMPLFDGDALTIAVDEKLLDTRSITYPPVGLRTLRSREGIYLRVPIADLTRDSDGDGLTDLAAAHLLVTAVDGTPAAYVVGRSPDAECGSDAAPLRAAMMAILDKVFSGGTGALFEPVDRDPGKLALPIRPRIDPNSADRPILIDGAPADYACLRPDRLMIVYGPAQLARLNRATPAFHAVSLSKVVFDRARDRGYLSWSTGWSGGTIRIRKVGQNWEIEDIGGWIT